MAIEYPHASFSAAQLALGALSVAERRAQIEHEQELAQAERRQQVDAQRSVFSSPQERIRLWEQLHVLKLPYAADHKLLSVIAAQTELSIEDLHEEQARRVAAKMQTPPV